MMAVLETTRQTAKMAVVSKSGTDTDRTFSHIRNRLVPCINRIASATDFPALRWLAQYQQIPNLPE